MDTPICYCGTVMEIEKRRDSGGMGECYDDWILSCPKCGITKTYPADDFYGRDFISDEKTVIDTWNNMRRENQMTNTEYTKSIFSDKERECARYWLINVKSRIKNHRDFEGDRWDKAIDMAVELIDERIKEL